MAMHTPMGPILYDFKCSFSKKRIFRKLQADSAEPSCCKAEAVGLNVMSELHDQRDSLKRSKERLE